MYKVFISPSNQDKNVYYDKSTNECENCNIIGSYLQKALERCGIEAVIAKVNDGASTRCKISNEGSADLHLPIHTNAGGGKGIEVYINKNADGATKNAEKSLAKIIRKNIKAISPSGKDRGTKEATFQELTDVPFSVYIEVDFHDNKEACAWLVTEQKNIAEALCLAVCEYFDVAYVSEEKIKVGDRVMFVGQIHYSSSTGNKCYNTTKGLAKVTAINKAAAHPYHLVREKSGTSNVYGWVNKEDVLPIHNIYTVGEEVKILADGVERTGIVDSVTDTEITVKTQIIEY